MSRHEHFHGHAQSEEFDWDSAYTGRSTDYVDPDEDLVRIISDLQSGTALDVGCGAGGLVMAMAELGWSVTGIDMSPNAIAAARKNLELRGFEADLFVADAGSWNTSARFDLVVSSFALPTTPKRPNACRMMRNALAPKGDLLIKEFDSGNQSKLPGEDLPTIDEIVEAFDGLQVVRAEIVDTPAHTHHGGESTSFSGWTALIFHARQNGHPL